ncbi:MAG: all-trans-retinol 13,14-reductase, partial [Deltaproteobacteria bacterium]|nr:all-trans-retinol 13,14-reductase [Deltaproteobacteria bacterium]
IEVAENVLPGLSDQIEVEVGMTPRTIQRYTLHAGGVPYGWDLVPEHYERIGNSTPIEGLLLAGSWAGMVHGAAGALMSGQRAAWLVLEQEGIE